MSNIPPPPDIGGIHQPDPRQKYDVIWIFAVVALLVLGLVVFGHAQQLNGLYVRPDGKVMVDSWDVVAGTQAAMPGNRSSVKVRILKFPTGFMFGTTCEDSMPICRETAKGSVCKTLGELFR